MEYSPWFMVLAFFLAIASVIPIVLICALRAMRFSILEIGPYGAPMSRIDTSASTKAMMPGVRVRIQSRKM